MKVRTIMFRGKALHLLAHFKLSLTRVWWCTPWITKPRIELQVKPCWTWKLGRHDLLPPGFDPMNRSSYYSWINWNGNGHLDSSILILSRLLSGLIFYLRKQRSFSPSTRIGANISSYLINSCHVMESISSFNTPLLQQGHRTFPVAAYNLFHHLTEHQ